MAGITLLAKDYLEVLSLQLVSVTRSESETRWVEGTPSAMETHWEEESQLEVATWTAKETLR